MPEAVCAQQFANSFVGVLCKDWKIGFLMASLSTVLPPLQTPRENAICTCENPTDDTATAAAGTGNNNQYPQHS